MTKTERIRAIVEGKPTDRVGVAGWKHFPMVDRNVTDFTRKTIEFTEYNDWDFVKLMVNGNHGAEAHGAKIHWKNDPAEWSGEIYDYPIKTPQDLLDLKPIDPLENRVYRDYIQVAKNVVDHYKGQVPVVVTMFSPLSLIQECSACCDPTLTHKWMKENKKEMHKACETLLETNKRLLDEFLKVGVDGIFFTTHYGSRDYISKEDQDEFCHPYDKEMFRYIEDRTWFNMFHIHYCEALTMEDFLDYPGVQAFNWENCSKAAYGKVNDPSKLLSVKQAREMTDKVLITGIDQHNDFKNADNDREAIKDVLRRRLEDALEQNGGTDKFIFASGCSLPMDIKDGYEFTLMQEVVKEFGLVK